MTSKAKQKMLDDAIAKIHDAMNGEPAGPMLHALIFNAARVLATVPSFSDRRKEALEHLIDDLREYFESALADHGGTAALRKVKGARHGDPISIAFGRAVHVDPTTVDSCFSCEGPAKAWPFTKDRSFDGDNIDEGKLAHGIVSVNDKIETLCETCHSAPDETAYKIARKVDPDADFFTETNSPEHVQEIMTALDERDKSSSH